MISLNNKKTIRTLVIILGGGLIVLTVGFYSVFIKTKAEYVFNRAEKLKLAKITLQYLDGRKDDLGRYWRSERCGSQEPEKCEEDMPSNRAGIPVIWGRFKYIQNLSGLEKNQELAKLIADIDVYSNREITPVIQRNFLNCRLMKDLWDSDMFDDQTKEKIKKICFDGDHELNKTTIDAFSEFKENQSRYEDIFLTNVKIMKNFIDGKESGVTTNKSALDQGFLLEQIPFYVSDQIAKYRKDNLDYYLLFAKWFFNLELQRLEYQKEKVFGGELCSIGLNATDFYGMDKNQIYLDFAKTMLDKGRAVLETINAENYALCAFLAEAIKEVSGDDSYAKRRDDILKQNTLLNFDYEKYAKKTGKGGYITRWINVSENNPRVNGILVGLLSIE